MQRYAERTNLPPLELDIMSMPVRIDEFLYKDAKRHAKAESRTISGQIEFWARIGKVALEITRIYPLTSFVTS